MIQIVGWANALAHTPPRRAIAGAFAHAGLDRQQEDRVGKIAHSDFLLGIIAQAILPTLRSHLSFNSTQAPSTRDRAASPQRMFWLCWSNSTLPVTPEKFYVAASVSRIDWESLPPRRTTSA